MTEAFNERERHAALLKRKLEEREERIHNWMRSTPESRYQYRKAVLANMEHSVMSLFSKEGLLRMIENSYLEELEEAERRLVAQSSVSDRSLFCRRLGVSFVR